MMKVDSHINLHHVLLAAQYLPEQPSWEDDAQWQALEHAQQIMETLPYPAIVLTYTFQVQAANKFFQRLLELPSQHKIPPHQCSMVNFLFHPDFRGRATTNAEVYALWQKHALYGLQQFK